MSYATKFARQFDYQSYQNANPTRPLPGDKVNVDFNYVVTSIDEIVEFQKLVQRSDGALQNGIVTVDALSDAVKALIGDADTLAGVVEGFAAVEANVAAALTASTSATDALNSASSASTSATAAATSETNAANSASAAAASATSAANSASAAAASATSASTSATNAANSAAEAAALVADNGVTNAKLADMAQATIKGRASGVGTGDPTDLTGAQVATIIGIGSTPREVLTANRTYYVRSDGSNSNNGLANTSGGAFLTIQKAIETVGMLDLSIYDVTIQCGANAAWGAFELKSTVGSGKVTILGDETTPANCTVTGAPAKALCVGSNYRGRWRISGFKFTTSSGTGYAIYIDGQCYLELGKNDYGACAGGNHLLTSGGAYISLTDSYTISGGTGCHIVSFSNSLVSPSRAITVTLTGTPAFSNVFVLADRAGIVAEAYFFTFSGSATGKRYQADNLSLIFTSGGGASFFPGNAAGTTATGGQYT